MSLFKNATVFRIAANCELDSSTIEAALKNEKFVPCGPTTQRSSGWSEPRGVEHGPLLESIDGQWILRLMTEKKDIPGSVVQQVVAERVAKIEEDQGRKPGKKEVREIKESVILEMLPKAFPKRSAVAVWIDPTARLLYVDSTSTSTTDVVVTALVKAIEGFAINLVNTTMSPSGAMATWLTEREIDDKFDFGRECELLASDESKACVKYARHNLDIVEIGDHIRLGKIPKSLSLTWNDRVTFVLNQALQIKKIKFLDSVMEEAVQGSDNSADAYNADVKIVTGELSSLFPDLVKVLGGEVELGAM
jgi:recombination associated protein RdgC